MPSAEYVRKAALAAKYGTGIVGLWKRGMDQIPEVVSSTGFAIIGAVGLLYLGYKDTVQENRTRRFKTNFTIMRPEDKMMKYLEIHRKETSPPITSTPAGFIPTKLKSGKDCGPQFKF